MSKISNKKKHLCLNDRTTILPHLELDNKPNTKDEILTICNKLKTQLTELTIIIYKENTYCKDLNGDWNVCFSVKESNIEEIYETYMYTYIIHSCNKTNKTYGSCLINYEYIYGLKITGLMESTNSKLFNIIENKLMELFPNYKKINYFENSLKLH